MEQRRKRLDRRSFWLWVVPLVLGHAVLVCPLLLLPMTLGTASSLASADAVLGVILAIAVARRWRHFGRPVGLRPSIMSVTIFGLPLVLGPEIMAYAVGHRVQLL